MPYSRRQADHILEIFDKRAYKARSRLQHAENQHFAELAKINAAALKKIDKKAIKDAQKVLDDWAISNIAIPALYPDHVGIQYKNSPELEAEFERIAAERKAARAAFFPAMAKGSHRSLDLDMKLKAIRAAREKLEMRIATEGSSVNLEEFFNEAKI